MAANRLAWLAAGLGLAGAAGASLLRRRRLTAELPLPPSPDPRAQELREKLAQARDLAGEREEFEGGETPVDQAEPSADLEARRRRVHEEGRAAADQMRGAGGGSEGF